MAKMFSLDSSMVGSMAWTPKHQSMLEGIITTGFKHLGKAIFVESQRRVPVVSGNLKSTGGMSITNDGFEITYTAPYASSVEQGSTNTAGSEPWVQNIPAHIRKTKKGRVRVAAHTKTYKSGKPIQMPDGQWRVSSNTNSKGRHFLGGSLQSLVTGSLSRNLGFQKYLQTDTI